MHLGMFFATNSESENNQNSVYMTMSIFGSSYPHKQVLLLVTLHNHAKSHDVII